MLAKKWALLIIFGLLFNFLNAFVPIVEADDPPEPYIYWNAPPGNNFGIQSFKTVNWSFFRDLFRSNIFWELEYNLGAGWQPGNQYLTINRTWNEPDGETSGYWKFALIFNNPVSGVDARFTFACNLSVLSYVHKVSAYTYFINYTVPGTNETYHCLFNFSDMINIPNIIFTHGVLNNMFWFRFRRDNIPAGTHIFDPTFGETGTGTGAQAFIGDVWSSQGSSGSDGIANNITAYVKCFNTEIRYALYWANNQTYFCQTEEKTVNTSGVFRWVEMNFSSTQRIRSSETYHICVWSNSANSFRLQSAGANDMDRYKTDYTGDFSAIDPLPITAQFAYLVCAYVTYTEAPVGDVDPPIISAENPSNGSINVTAGFNVNLIWNCTIRDNSSFNWTIEIPAVGIDNAGISNSSNGDTNGSKNITINDVEYLFIFIIWVNATDGNNSVSEVFNFTADNQTCPPFDGNDSEIWLYTGDVIEFDTTQFNFIVLVILISFFTALGETADCKNPKIKIREYFRRAVCFFIVTILCIYGGVANAQTFAWYFSFVFLIMAGFYGFRCFINFGNMKKSEVT